MYTYHFVPEILIIVSHLRSRWLVQLCNLQIKSILLYLKNIVVSSVRAAVAYIAAESLDVNEEVYTIIKRYQNIPLGTGHKVTA